FQRSGWFITNLSPHGMDIEHRGNEYHEATGEVKHITFKKPFLKPVVVGPDGFSHMREFEPIALEELKAGWKARQKKEKELRQEREAAEKKRKKEFTERHRL
nr:hypothetical protein [Acidobacteriota bacterium]